MSEFHSLIVDLEITFWKIFRSALIEWNFPLWQFVIFREYLNPLNKCVWEWGGGLWKLTTFVRLKNCVKACFCSISATYYAVNDPGHAQLTICFIKFCKKKRKKCVCFFFFLFFFTLFLLPFVIFNRIVRWVPSHNPSHGRYRLSVITDFDTLDIARL